MRPQEYLEKKGIRKTTYNGVRLVSDTDHMYKVSELMAWYADSQKSSDTSRIIDRKKLLESFKKWYLDNRAICDTLESEDIDEFLSFNSLMP